MRKSVLMKHRILFVLAVTALMCVSLSCKKQNSGVEAASQERSTTSLYGVQTASAQAVQSYSQQDRARTQVGQRKAQQGNTDVHTGKAKIIRLYEIPAPLKNRPEQILRRKGYTTSYNKETRCPNWVAWHLTKSHTYGNAQRSQEKFMIDEDAKGARATDNDYYNSRYDRGHMCPAGDNKWDRTAMRETFLFTNICPQNHGLNKYEWNDLEIQCRDWAREYGAIDIVCGPVYYGRGTQKTIGSNRVWVPDAFFKVVLCRLGTPKAIGFVYRNEGKKQSREQAVYSVDEIERMTGIDFFPELDDRIELKVEAEARLADW